MKIPSAPFERLDSSVVEAVEHPGECGIDGARAWSGEKIMTGTHEQDGALPVGTTRNCAEIVTPETTVSRGFLDLSKRGRGAAWAAFAVGILYTAISVYWALGGRWLLADVGSNLVAAPTREAGLLIAMVWAAVFIKFAGAIVPIMAVPTQLAPSVRRIVRGLAWAEAAILTLYGLVWTSVGLLVQIHFVRTPANADHVALAWHAFVWDPWFLVWGILVLIAMNLTKSSHLAPS
jgi:hypothetical protein